jgi:TetR/AcrR family transcriptional regulator
MPGSTSPPPDADDGGVAVEAGEVAARTEKHRRILEVAIREFAEKGMAGARVANIAKQAGVNNRLPYYYFQTKEGLFTAALGHMVSVAHRVMNAQWGDGTYGEQILGAIHPRAIERRQTLRRLWVWQALERGDEPILLEERQVWEQATGLIRDAQKAGSIDEDFDAEMTTLAVDAMFNSPFMLPQVTKLITGMDPSTEEFRERMRAFMVQVFARMAPRD